MTTLESDINWVWPWPPKKSEKKRLEDRHQKLETLKLVKVGISGGNFDLKVCTELSSLEFRRFIPPEFLFLFSI